LCANACHSTVEFRVPLKPDEEKTITYTVRHNWQ
jgi:hypothetical protein